MSERAIDWQERYVTGDTPWDSGEPSKELERILNEGSVRPCRALELGCGTGTNAVFLAGRGFDMTATDLVPLALDAARQRAEQAGASVRFFEADFFALPDIGPPFPFVFDRGLYHVLRNVNVVRYCEIVANLTEPGGLYLTLAGNANEPNPPEGGPPRVHAHDICQELGSHLELVQLREFRFDGVRVQGRDIRPLAWSALLRRKRA